MARQNISPLPSQQPWPRPLRRAGVRTLVAVSAGVLAGVLLDRALAVHATAPARHEREAEAAAMATDTQCTSPVAAARTNVEPRSSHAIAARAPEIAAQEEDDEDVDAFRAKQSAELLGLVQHRLRIAQMSISGRTPEGAANQLRLYQTGLIDGILRTAPELAGALGAQIERVLCEPQANPATLMSLLQMVGQMPDLASARGFECILGSGRPEDIVLWTGLDVLRATEVPHGALLEQLARSAKDERTTQRLATLRNANTHRPVRPEPTASARSMSEEPSQAGAPLDEENEEP